MRLRRFAAPTMEEAMALVRQSLGPDAIIVSTYEAKRGRGVEVTAAIEDDLIETAASPRPQAASQTMRPQATSQTMRPQAVPQTVPRPAPPKPAQRPTVVEPDWAMEAPVKRAASRETELIADEDWVPLRRTLRQAPPEAVMNSAPRRQPASRPQSQQPRPQMPQARPQPQQPQQQQAAPRRAERAPEQPNAERDRLIAQALDFHAVPRPIADALFNAARAIDTDEAEMALAGALDSRLSFAPLAPVPRRPTMLLGPVSAGKTVTVAKIAAKAVLSGAAINIITTDTLRAGAIAQIETYSNVLEQELGIEETADGLGERLMALEPERAVIIDTPGANPYATHEMTDLALFVSAAPDIDPILVLAAGGDARETGEIAAAFRRLGVKRLIVTRLDAARRLGGLIAAADSGLTLTQISTSPYVADALVSINPVSLARMMLARAEPKSSAMEAASA